MKYLIIVISILSFSTNGITQSKALLESIKVDELTNKYITEDLLPKLIKKRKKLERKLSKKEKRFIDSLRVLYNQNLLETVNQYINLNDSIKLSKRDSIRMSTYRIFPSTGLFLNYKKNKSLTKSKKVIYDGVTDIRQRNIYTRKKLTEKLNEIFIRDRYIKKRLCQYQDLSVLDEPVKVIPGKGPHLSKTYFGGYFGFLLMDYKQIRKYLRKKK